MEWKREQTEYCELFGVRCELTGIFDREVRHDVERDYHLPPRRELHHILGRQKNRPDLYEVRSNWIMLDSPVHKWITDNKFSGTLPCLYAKLKKSRTTSMGNLDSNAEFVVGDLMAIVSSDSLTDYVEHVMGKVGPDDPHYHYGRLLLELI